MAWRTHAEPSLHDHSKLLDLTQALVRDMQGCIVQWILGEEPFYGYERADAMGQISHEPLGAGFPEPLDLVNEKLVRPFGKEDAALQHPQSWPLRILLVDDDPILLKSLRISLELDGHALLANGGQQGTAAFHEGNADGQTFDVVIKPRHCQYRWPQRSRRRNIGRSRRPCDPALGPSYPRRAGYTFGWQLCP
jgi:hypothetical protein